MHETRIHLHKVVLMLNQIQKNKQLTNQFDDVIFKYYLVYEVMILYYQKCVKDLYLAKNNELNQFQRVFCSTVFTVYR